MVAISQACWAVLLFARSMSLLFGIVTVLVVPRFVLCWSGVVFDCGWCLVVRMFPQEVVGAIGGGLSE